MGSIKMSAEDKKRERQWRTESDLEALKRAKEITSDKTRLAAVQSMAKQQLMALGGIVNTSKKPSAKKK